MKKAFLAATLDHLIRPHLKNILPPEAFIKLYSRTRTWFLDMLASCRHVADVPHEEVDVHGLKFRNCLMNAAGLDKDGKLLAFNYLLGAGGAVVGTVLSEPWSGNLISTYGGRSNPWTPLPCSNSAINSLGLPSHGIDNVVSNVRYFRDVFAPIDFPIIASVMGHPAHKDEKQKLAGIVKCVQKLIPYVDGFELNESCPNTQHSDAGLELRLKTVLGICETHYEHYSINKPLWVKMRDAGNAEYTVEFMTKMDVDGLALTNTQINYAELRKHVHEKDLALFDYYTQTHKGGVSGPIIREFALSQVAAAARAIEKQKSHLVITDIGGISSHHDIAQGRAVNPKIVKLHEWYTGKMNAIATEEPDRIYQNMIFGKK